VVFAEGDTVAGRYRLVRLLGEGGMGRVYIAQRNEMGGHVALKLLRSDIDLPATSIERFRREAQAAAQLKSESVVRVLDMGVTDDGTPFIVMERVSGKTLAQHLVDHGPLELARAVDIVIDVCAVLAEAHAHGIIHRDIKSSNIALTKRPDGTELAKVLDFGIAKQTDADVSSLTETATVLGSPKYMSPDQIRDARQVGPRDDLWSLAVVLQEITTGALPFEAFTISGLFAKIVADPPTPARAVRADLPEAFEALLLKALTKDPAARFADAAEVAEALATFASPEGASRAKRVRPIFAHAAATLASEPAAAVPAPSVARQPETVDLEVTNAPIAREHPVSTAAVAPASSRRTRVMATVLVLTLLSLGIFWRTRASQASSAAPVETHGALPASSPAPEAPSTLSPMATTAGIASTATTSSASMSAARPPLAAPRVVPASSARAFLWAGPTAASTTPSAPRHVMGAASSRRPIDDDDFGPRQ